MIEPDDAASLKVLEGHTRYVNTCGFSPDNLLLATGNKILIRIFVVIFLKGYRINIYYA